MCPSYLTQRSDTKMRQPGRRTRLSLFVFLYCISLRRLLDADPHITVLLFASWLSFRLRHGLRKLSVRRDFRSASGRLPHLSSSVKAPIYSPASAARTRTRDATHLSGPRAPTTFLIRLEFGLGFWLIGTASIATIVHNGPCKRT